MDKGLRLRRGLLSGKLIGLVLVSMFWPRQLVTWVLLVLWLWRCGLLWLHIVVDPLAPDIGE